jgi:peptidoglycan/xylan/chitin deacetylase (PgdA/CDA1 family)
VSFLKRRFPIVTLEEVLEFCDRPSRLKTFCMLITFDDGYRDNYQLAFPILRSHGVQGTFFLPSAFIGTRQIPWWDQINFLLRSSARRTIQLRYPVECSLPLHEATFQATARRVLTLYKSPQTADASRFLTELETACEVERPRTADEPLFMDWNEAREMVRGGMAIGSHTHTHSVLAKLPYSQQYEELAASRDLLRQNLNVDADCLAFPVGGRTSFSTETFEALSNAGYRAAFSFYGGLNTPRNIRRFDLMRHWVEADTTMPVFRLRTLTAAATARFVY